jgi:L-asparaginase II
VDYRPVLEVTRGDVVESVHYGAVAVADVHGRLIAVWGDPESVTFLRSSAKPFQALPLLESGAAERMAIPDRELAIVCASHSGTDAHVETVRALQARIGVEESDLRCGVHPPYDHDTAQRLRRDGLEPTPNRHNCSGKHTGMLAQARFHAESIDGYIERAHPVQGRILEAIAGMCALDPAQVEVGIDGCSVPTFAVPLRAAATAFARLADPTGLGEVRAAACRRIYAAMTGHPDMVAGWDRFDTHVMALRPGAVLAKGGAEGYQGLALAPGAAGAKSPALGIALKISDGDLGKRSDRPPGQRARSRVVASVLQQLGVLAASDLDRLSNFLDKRVTNWRGLEVGEMRACLRLEISGL